MTQVMTRRAALGKGLAVGALALGLPQVLEACASGSSARSGATTNSLTVALPYNVSGFDGFGIGFESYGFLGNLYDTLIGYRGKNVPYPRLAKSWSIADDHMSAEVKLRPGGKFQNGEALDATAVVKNFQRAAAPLTGGNMINVVTPIKGVVVVDTHTVRFQMTDPTPSEVITDILETVNLLAPSAMDLNYVKHKGVGAGPFAFDSYIPGNQFVLKRFPGFWGHPLPNVDQVTFIMSSDTEASVASLQAGSADLVAFLPPSDANKLKHRFNIVEGPSGALTWELRLNATQPPFNNKMIRQGMQYAVDRQKMVSDVLYGYSKPIVLPFPSTSPAYDPSAVAKYPFNLQTAKQMFTAAGSPTWSTTAVCDSSYPELVSMMEILQSDLASIGCTLKLNTTTGTELSSIVSAGTYSCLALITSNIQKYPSRISLNSVYRTVNNPLWKNQIPPTYISAMNAANTAVTQSAQQAAFKQLQSVLLDESWVIDFCQNVSLCAVSKKFSNVSFNIDDYLVLENVRPSS